MGENVDIMSTKINLNENCHLLAENNKGNNPSLESSMLSQGTLVGS